MNQRTVLLMVSLGTLAVIIVAAWFYFRQYPPTVSAPTSTPVEMMFPASPESESTDSAIPQVEDVGSSQTIVQITASGFEPATLTIKVGETVTWVNQDTVVHNVSSDPHPVHTNYPSLNLGNIQAGQAKSLKFDKAGIYTYHDHLNPARRGTVIVQ